MFRRRDNATPTASRQPRKQAVTNYNDFDASNEYPEVVAWNDFKQGMLDAVNADRAAELDYTTWTEEKLCNAHDDCYEMEAWDECDRYAAELRRRGYKAQVEEVVCDDCDEQPPF